MSFRSPHATRAEGRLGGAAPETHHVLSVDHFGLVGEDLEYP